MFALADINSFYASCEKVFRPDLRNEPVIVLSNNDGCVIARSPEAKALGIRMGQPWFQVAKSAQWATKQWPQFSGVVALTAENRNRILKLLGLQPVGEVWGVGRRLTEKLNALGINTALQLAQANTAFIRKNFSVILERTVRELNGESCISLEEAPPAKQQIVCSRSFGERITDKDAMHQAVAQYAERAAEKIRWERQY